MGVTIDVRDEVVFLTEHRRCYFSPVGTAFYLWLILGILGGPLFVVTPTLAFANVGGWHKPGPIDTAEGHVENRRTIVAPRLFLGGPLRCWCPHLHRKDPR